MGNDGIANLIPVRTEEEAREKGRNGGIASGKARKEKKTMAQLTAMILAKNIDTMEDLKQCEDVKPLVNMLDEDRTLASLMVAGQARSAMSGNTKAFEALSNLNEKEQKNDDSKAYTLPITDITTDFVEVYREMHEAFENGKWREFILKGGRGSIKSNFISAFAEEVIYNDSQAHIVFTRRYKTDLRGSVYNQFLKTVTRHNKLDEWDFTTSPMMARYKKTGQCVIFVGCDKPISLKSYNLSFGYVKMVVNEECDEMAGIEQIDNVEDTFLRADVNSISVKVFNPPKSANNWMNEYTADAPKRDKCFVCHSYYYNVPIKWLGQRFFDRAEWFKQHKQRYYDNNYLGLVTGTGGTIFENLDIRTITDAEINALPNRYHGLDFGFVHPQAFIECSYDFETETVYIVNEIRKVGMKQETFAKKCKQYSKVEIIADSANPDKISDWCDYGFDVIGATKRWSGGGRDYAWEWLQTRRKIVIDAERTPFVAKEMQKAEFEQLKDGSFSSQYPTLDEDCIMATVYALNRVIIDEKSMNGYDDSNEDDYDDED